MKNGKLIIDNSHWSKIRYQTYKNSDIECLGQKVTVFKQNNSRYFLYQSFFLGNIKYYDSIVNQVSIKHLTKEKLSRVIWLCPPLSEQKAIACYLDEKTAHCDQIIATINTQIEKLKELRKSLINDVVTGKIKVVEN